ncbi:hypothetical protein COT03_02210 [Candidatus Shapirobacteria bacterium CG07_land_8_20_14_0_80_39_18]|uniref:Uncharacterized protein n=1 Tax=Candidatus Shapirobacteria bacterium CG07_land_8_20_14_0_80_39_18 TaxID=1974882 RepID=A0A2M6YR51_9BACT|nr:MAG: hypothetical protein COT03_02210 [Candidatus Shapirobacteria bacterium CG07_land_8_20_14_0_80_39_18]
MQSKILPRSELVLLRGLPFFKIKARAIISIFFSRIFSKKELSSFYSLVEIKNKNGKITFLPFKCFLFNF